METNPSSSSSFSSSSSPAKKHHVFLSFRGDIRHGFISHLDSALRRSGLLSIFKDENEIPKSKDKLQEGEDTEEQLMEAIKNSEYAVVVISEKYADSTWCLKEVAKIVECKRKPERIRTIFYKVDVSDVRDVDSTDVERRGKSSFSKALDQHKINHDQDPSRFDYSESWRSALSDVCKDFPYYVKSDTDEASFIKKFVADISSEIGASIKTLDGLFGMTSRLEKLDSYVLDYSAANKVCFIGIHGMPGVGKTTLAEAYHMMSSHKFGGSCFLANIRQVCEKQVNGLVDLQTKLLKDILGEDCQVGSVTYGINLIRSRFRGKKVLIILDDVSDPKQLEVLVDSHKKKQGSENDFDEWFSPGSVIIVTTQNADFLTKRYEKHEVECLDDNDSLELFSWKAFGSIEPPEEFKDLSKKVVKYVSNLPLALTVLGSLFGSKEKSLWPSLWGRLENYPEKGIFGILEISFDDLDPEDQRIFLDIACCFVGALKADVIRILDGCGFMSEYGISNLIGRSLLRFRYGMIWMHDLQQVMAEHIDRKESGNELGRRRRIWKMDDIHQILENEEGTDGVEAISTVVDKTEEYKSFEALKPSSMKKLRILCIYGPEFDDYGDCVGPELSNNRCVGPELSNNLRCLEWMGFPYNEFASSFHPGQLVQLNLRYSMIKQLWNDFAVVPNLQILDLYGCNKLSEIQPSIGCLKRLIRLNLNYCTSLTKLPEEISGLTSLQRLGISGCFRVDKLPDNLEQLKNLRDLEIDRSGIKHLPSSIIFMENLEYVDCEDEGMIESAVRENIISYRTTGKCFISGWFCSRLWRLDLSDCNLTGPEAFPEYFGKLVGLRNLDLSKNPFSVLPPINGLSRLTTLRLEHCTNLISLEAKLLPSSLEEVYVNYCTSLTSFLDPLKPCHLSCSAYCLDCTELVTSQDGKMTALASLSRFLEGPQKRRGNQDGKMTELASLLRFYEDLQKRGGNQDFLFVVPQRDNKLPFWFNQSSTGSISIKLDPNCRNSELIGVAMVACFPANSSTEDNFSCNIRIYDSENWETTIEMGVIGSRMSDHLSLLYRPCNDTLERIKQLEPQSCNTLEFSFLNADDEHSVSHGPCGVRLVYEGDREGLKNIISGYINDQKDVQS